MALDTQSRNPSPAAPGAAAVLAWAAAQGAVLRGLVHALSNRVGTVVAVGGMLDGAPAESAATGARVLAGEGERLEALLAGFRLATADAFGADAVPEPLHLGELLAEVTALAAYAEGAAVRVEAAPNVPPVVAARAALAQALLVLVRAAGGARGTVTLRAGRDGAHVRVWAAAGDDEHAALVAPDTLVACVWLLGAGAVELDAGVAEVRLPALGG